LKNLFLAISGSEERWLANANGIFTSPIGLAVVYVEAAHSWPVMDDSDSLRISTTKRGVAPLGYSVRFGTERSEVQIFSPRLNPNTKSRQWLRKRRLAGFDLLHGRFALSRLYAAQGSRPRREAARAFSPGQTRLRGKPVPPGLRYVEAGVLGEDARPVTVGFEPEDHLRIDDRAGRPRACEPTWRFAFQHLAAHDDSVKTVARPFTWRPRQSSPPFSKRLDSSSLGGFRPPGRPSRRIQTWNRGN
jgi:hypothetical protein